MDLLFSQITMHNVAKNSYGFCFWALDPLIGPGALEQSPNELL